MSRMTDDSPHCRWAMTGSDLHICLLGPIDSAASAELAAIVRQADLGSCRKAVVDFAEATFIGAAALNFLAGLIRCCDTVELVGTHTQPLLPRMLTAVGLNLGVVHPA